jgi:RHS repeat-associated protein
VNRATLLNRLTGISRHTYTTPSLRRIDPNGRFPQDGSGFQDNEVSKDSQITPQLANKARQAHFRLGFWLDSRSLRTGAGAASSQAIVSGDGYVELTASETTTSRMIGLSNGDTNQNYPDIDFAAYLDSGNLCVYEAGSNRGCFSTYVGGNTIRVAVESGVVKYKKNGTVIYTSSVTPTYPLLVDTALWSNGATLNNVVISGGGSGGANVHWLVADHLGTPRMIVDQTGTLANLKRHDYLPFGEELFAGRTAPIGYSGGDGVRQQFTSKERDNETGLDYFLARYYGATQGRFTSADPLNASARRQNPQTWNRYSYVLNRPLSLIDPNGMHDCSPQTPCIQTTDAEAMALTTQNPSRALIQASVDVNIGSLALLTTTASDPGAVSISPKPLAGGESQGGGGFGWGVTGGASAAVGMGLFGAGGAGNVFAGQFVDRETGQVTQGLGASGGFQASIGGAAGLDPAIGAGTSYPTLPRDQLGDGLVIGNGAGAGAGLFFTNAKRIEELRGPFWTRIVSTPWLTVQYDRSGNVGVLSFTYGPSARAFYWSGPTTAVTTPSFPGVPTGMVLVPH